MSYVKVIVPYTLALYFILKARKQPVFLLGIPFLMSMGTSIFFERAILFYKPGSWGLSLNILKWMIASWFYIKVVANRQITLSASGNSGKKNFLTLMDSFVGLLLVLSVMNLISNLAEYRDTSGMMAEAADYVSLLIGYFFLKSIFIHSDERSLISFLDAIVLIITIGSLIFVLHQGLGFRLHEGEEYLETSVGREIITRTWMFMPIYVSFAFVYSLSKGRFTLTNMTSMLINGTAIFFSYARSVVFGLVLIIGVYYALVAIKGGRKLRIMGKVLKFGLALLLGIYLASLLFPAQYYYFSSRMEDLALNPQQSNFTYRLDQTQLLFASLRAQQFFLGSGFLSASENSIVDWMKLKTSDIVWAGVGFHWGAVGLLLFGLLCVMCLVKTYKIFLGSTGAVSYLALLLFLLVLNQLAEGFGRWTFLNPIGLPMGLWYVAAASALTGWWQKGTRT